jgi:hypothetical protein
MRRIHLFLILIFVFSTIFITTAKAEEKDNAGRMADASGFPLIADADTGYGGPVNLQPTIGAFERAGVAEVPPGMEIIQIRNVSYLLPKGTQIRKRGGVITFEGLNEYTARRLSAFEERLQASEKEIERLKSFWVKKKRE